jgi:uncharacterized protein YbjT (DUF2867 family)
MSKICVAGASGEVGREVVRALTARGIVVRALVRTARVPGTEEVAGDLADRASIARALEGCAAAIFITPHGPDEEQLGNNFLDECEAAGIGRVVYVSAFHPLSRSHLVQWCIDRLLIAIGPHYAGKIAIERRLRRSPQLSPVILCPTNFYQNDALGLTEIHVGRYPQPLGDRPANRVDTRDIADAAAIAVTTDLPSGSYPLVGPDAWTGASCAEAWARALGHEVAYAGNDIATWNATVGARMPTARAADYAKTYAILQRHGIPVGRKALARTTALLGRAPRSYDAYIREIAASSYEEPEILKSASPAMLTRS